MALALSTATAAAQDARARLDYERSPEAAACPEDAVLRDAVSARLGYVPFDEAADRTVRVRITRRRRELLASVEVVDASGAVTGSRELSARVRGATCALEDALVLAVSLAIDPMTLARVAEPAPTPAPACPAAEPCPECAVCAECPAPPGPEPCPAEPTPLAAPPFRGRLSIAAVFELAPLPLPSAALRIAGGARIADFSFDVEVRGDVPMTGSDAEGRTATATWLAGTLALCGHLESVALCGIVASGVIVAWGGGVERPRTDAAGFATVGARLGLELPVSDTIDILLSVEGALVTTPTELVVDRSLVHTVPPAVLGVTAGVLFGNL